MPCPPLECWNISACFQSPASSRKSSGAYSSSTHACCGCTSEEGSAPTPLQVSVGKGAWDSHRNPTGGPRPSTEPELQPTSAHKRRASINRRYPASQLLLKSQTVLSSYSHLEREESSVCLRKASPATSQDKSGFPSSTESEANTLRPAALANIPDLWRQQHRLQGEDMHQVCQLWTTHQFADPGEILCPALSTVHRYTPLTGEWDCSRTSRTGLRVLH